LLDGYRQRDELEWDSARLQLVDLQYSDVNPDKGLALRLQQRGRLQRLTTDDQVAAAIATPPTDTRAWFRGECIRRFGPEVAAASWDSVIFDLPQRSALQRVPTWDPFRGTKAHVGELLDRTASAADLVRILTGGQ
jgi:proteasome accessory factor A